ATTGDATSITNGSARLNGVINTTSPSSLWAFQYGRTNSYGTVTQSHPAGAGVTVVSLKITGLSPGTKYHFRLIVSQGITNSTGADHSLTTTKLRLRKRKLRVSHHKVTIPLKC